MKVTEKMIWRYHRELHHKRLRELVSVYLSKAKMDEVLIEIYDDVISFDDALDIVLEDALYDLNFTEDEAKEFHHLVKIYKKEE